MKTSKRIWSKEELTIVYYIAKWDLSGIDISMEELAEAVIGNTTLVSLNMQVSHFKNILNIEETNLTGASNLMRELLEDYRDCTMTQIRARVISKIQSSVSNIISHKKIKASLESSKRIAKLNKASDLVFENKLKGLRKHRNLRKI
tara:strand:+ start:381 stop:818 length:438 start_codon:yes stop_codon:yes gene_type:complete